MMTLLERFDRLATEIREALLDAGRQKLKLNQLHSFMNGLASRATKPRTDAGRRAKATKPAGGRKRSAPLSAAKAGRVKDRLLAVLEAHPEGVQMGQIRKTLGLAVAPARRLLGELQAEKRARRQGTRRAARYFVAGRSTKSPARSNGESDRKRSASTSAGSQG